MGRRAQPTDLRSMHEFQFEVVPCSVVLKGKTVEAVRPLGVLEPSQSARAMMFPWKDSAGVLHWLVHPRGAPGMPTRRGIEVLRSRSVILSCGMYPVELMKVVSTCGVGHCASPEHVAFVEAPRKSGKRALTDSQVVEIRESSAKVRDLARRFGVNPGIVSAARNGRTYQYVRAYADSGPEEEEMEA